MRRIRFWQVVFLAAVLGLVGCTPEPSVPVSVTNTLVVLTETPQPSVTASATVTPTATRRPTSTPFPTFAAYAKIPERVDDGWQVGSLSSAGIDGVKISEMLESIYHGEEHGDTLRRMHGGNKMQNIHGILIARHGKLVFEEYFYHYNRTNWHNTASVTKSVTSLLVGIAIKQGYLEGVEQAALPFFEDYQPLPDPDERWGQITIEDLLTMRHGIQCDDWLRSSPTYWKRDRSWESGDVIEFLFNLPMEFAPGEHFSYCSTGTIMLGGVLARATGMTVQQFSEQNLFALLGITSYGWQSAAGGWADTGGSMQMRMRDMLKLGQMALQGGAWEGQQVVPQAWIEQSVRKHVDLEFNQSWGSGYGYLWWLSDVRIDGKRVHSFAASGAGGQVITVYPELELVVVITGWNIDPDNGEPFQIMERWILPAVVGR